MLNLSLRDLPFIASLGGGPPFDDFESYADLAVLNAKNGGTGWAGAWMDESNPFSSANVGDDFESYSDAASLAGLNSGTGWSGAWLADVLQALTFSPLYLTAFPTDITITSPDSGVSIYYTTDGSTPTTSSTLYTGPVTISSAHTLKAIAVKTGYVNSPVKSVLYDIDVELNDWISRVQGQGSDVTGSGVVSAVRTFVNGLKADAVWDKIGRLNIYVGDDLNALKAPLKNTIGAVTDTLANFDSGDFNIATGLTGDGVNEYLDTGIAMNTTDMGVGDNNLHIGVYVRTSQNGTQTLIGSQGSGLDTVIHVSYSGVTYFDANVYTSSRISYTDANGTGHYIGTRTSISSSKLYKAGAEVGSDSGAGGSRTSVTMYVHAMHDASLGAYQPTTRTLEMYHFGVGLTATDASNITSRYATLRTALGR